MSIVKSSRMKKLIAKTNTALKAQPARAKPVIAPPSGGTTAPKRKLGAIRKAVAKSVVKPATPMMSGRDASKMTKKY